MKRAQNSFMCTFTNAAGITVEYELAVKYGIIIIHQRMLYDPVPHGRSRNDPFLWGSFIKKRLYGPGL